MKHLGRIDGQPFAIDQSSQSEANPQRVSEMAEHLPGLAGAADRALEWRGDEVALPAQTIDMAGGGGEARPLDDGEIGATINSQAGGARTASCKARPEAICARRYR